jgi:hypothetical protein
MALHNGGMVNRVLTGSEVSRLYEEFIDSPKSSDLPRRNFVQVPRGLTDAEYAAKGIVLDTAFELVSVGGSRRILDMGPNNYAGTISGVVTPAKDGTGIRIGTVTDNVLFPDVTQLNSAVSFTYEEVCEFNDVNLPAAGYQAIKFLNVSNYIAMGPIVGAAGATKKHSTVIANGSVTYASTVANVLRKGCKQHIVAVYNGAGVTNADKYQVYIDGKSYLCDFPGGNLPSTGPNLAAQALQTGATTGTPRIVESQRWSIPPMTAAQARASYLEFARRVVFKQTFEDVPVSLAAVGIGGYIGSWRVLSGSWKCTESADGRRWLECVTSGNIVDTIPDPLSNGTKRFTFVHASAVTMRFGWMLKSLMAIGSADPTLAQQGYAFHIDSTGRTMLWRLDSAASPAVLWDVPGYLPVSSTEYTVTVSRQPSDGLISTWVSGGAYNNSIPSAPVADPTYQPNPSYFQVQATPGDKVLLWDPKDSKVGIVHYQGQLEPNEIW